MKNQSTLIVALVAIVALCGLVLTQSSTTGQVVDTTGLAMNPHIGCPDGQWTYVYGVQDAGGLRCIESNEAPVGSSYSGGGGLGSWPENQNIRRNTPTRGFTQQEIEFFRRQANIAENTYR